MKRIFAITSLAFALLTCVLLLASCQCKHTYSEWQTTKEATCTEAGEKTRTCSKCNEVETEPVAALDHDMGALITAKEPTCTEDGYAEHYHCARCGKDFAQNGTEIEASLPASHKLEPVAEVKSCSANGVAAHDHCTVCGKNFIGGVEKTDDELKTLPVDHTLKSVAEVGATCTADGVAAHDHCTVCGKNFIEGVEKTDDELKTDALGHNYYTVEALDATCTTDGVIAHLHCDGCGSNVVKGVEKTDDELKIPASHSLITVSGVEKTCTTDGVIEHERCTVCGKSFIDGIEKTDDELKIPAGHELENVAGVAKTCTTDGVAAHEHCTVCGKNFIEGVEKTDDELKIETTGHTYGNLISESGKRDHYQCSGCGKYFDASHNEITVLDIPTGHTFGVWTAEVPATCYGDGTKGYYTCSDAECAGKYFDIDYNEIDDINIPAAHKWVLEYNDYEHYFVCTVCSNTYNYEYHDLTATTYVKENNQWYSVKECNGCDYSEKYPFDKTADVSAERIFVVDSDDIHSFRVSALYENGNTSSSSISLYLSDVGAFNAMVAELKAAGVFPVTRTVTLSRENFTKDVEITFDLYRTEAVPEYTVYQQGYLNNLGDIGVTLVSNSGYTSDYIRLSETTITNDGGFDPDYDFADGDKVYTISFTYDEKEYTLSFTYVNRAVVRKIESYDSYVNLGEYPSIRIEYTDNSSSYTEVLSMFDMTYGSFDKNTLGKQTFTLKSKDGFATETFIFEVVDSRIITSVDSNVYMALNDGTFKVKVYYNDGPSEYLTLTPYAIINPDLYGSGAPFDNTKAGEYHVIARIKDYDAELCINVYDPENLLAKYIYLQFDTPILCETDAKGNVIIDATYLYIIAALNNGTEELVQFGTNGMSWTANKYDDETGYIEVTYKGATTNFGFKIAEKNVGNIYVCTKENNSVDKILAKDGVLGEEYFLKVSSSDGYYYYVPLTADMFYLGGEQFDLSTAGSNRYNVTIKYGSASTDTSLFVYNDGDISKSFYGGGDTAICGSYEYVLSQIAKMNFYYREELNFSGSWASICSEDINFEDIIVGDVSEYDFTKPGEVKIPLTYKGIDFTLELMLIPDLSLYDSEEYTIERWGDFYVAQVYDMGYIVYDGNTYTFEIVDEANGVYESDDYLYVVNEDEKTIVRFKGSMLGVEPTVYSFQGMKIEIYTKNGVSYADAYERDGEGYDYTSTSKCVLGDGTVEIEGITLSVVPGTNELTVYTEGETVYTYVETYSPSNYLLYQFNDSGKIYLFTVTTNPETSEETRSFLTYAEWEQTDNVITIIVDGRPEMTFSVDDKGNLTKIR